MMTLFAERCKGTSLRHFDGGIDHTAISAIFSVACCYFVFDMLTVHTLRSSSITRLFSRLSIWHVVVIFSLCYASFSTPSTSPKNILSFISSARKN